MHNILKLNIGKYFVISVLASIIDFAVAYLLFKKAAVSYLVAANTGIIIGFIFQYLLSSIYVFENKRQIFNFVVYIATFLLGIVLANGTMMISYEVLELPFELSKALSMIVPFFIMYLIRRKVLGLKPDRGETK